MPLKGIVVELGKDFVSIFCLFHFKRKNSPQVREPGHCGHFFTSFWNSTDDNILLALPTSSTGARSKIRINQYTLWVDVTCSAGSLNIFLFIQGTGTLWPICHADVLSWSLKGLPRAFLPSWTRRKMWQPGKTVSYSTNGNLISVNTAVTSLATAALQGPLAKCTSIPLVLNKQ